MVQKVVAQKTVARTLIQGETGFDVAFADLVAMTRAPSIDVRPDVEAILDRVAKEGDRALIDLTRRFDRHELDLDQLRIDPALISGALTSIPNDLREDLELAASRIGAFHRRQMPDDLDYEDELGVRLGQRWRPIDAVGLYVPGGTAAYPSSFLMNALPATIAGVGRLVVTTPMPDGVINPLVLAAAAIAGVEELYGIGGAQAVAALAYGTETITPVDKIVGPGNAFVTEAKRQVFGQVGIDMTAGPSEILVVADGDQDPAWIAADLLSQAEHDTLAQSILLTDDAKLASAVGHEVEAQLETLSRRDIAALSWASFGAIVIIDDLVDAPAFIDRLAPEHLELMVADPAAMADKVTHAGSIFLGPYTPEVIGDYVGGPNHVLPTSRSARFLSGLSVHDFLKRSTLLGCSQASFDALAPAAARLAHAEGLDGHARAIERRLHDQIEAATRPKGQASA